MFAYLRNTRARGVTLVIETRGLRFHIAFTVPLVFRADLLQVFKPKVLSDVALLTHVRYADGNLVSPVS